MSDVNPNDVYDNSGFFTTDVNPNDVADFNSGLEFIRNFLENQRLNDFYNVAIDEYENKQNQENSRYVFLTHYK